MTEKKLSAGDVAQLRALARQVKLFCPEFDTEACREDVRIALSCEVPDEMIELLAMCCDPEFIEALTSRAMDDFHTKGDLI